MTVLSASYCVHVSVAHVRTERYVYLRHHPVLDIGENARFSLNRSMHEMVSCSCLRDSSRLNVRAVRSERVMSRQEKSIGPMVDVAIKSHCGRMSLSQFVISMISPRGGASLVTAHPCNLVAAQRKNTGTN